MMLAPLFPFMSRAAMLRVLQVAVARALTGAGDAPRAMTRLSEPGRYVVALDRVNVRGTTDEKAFEVWGRGFIHGYCSAAELQRWVSGAGGVAVHVEGLSLDYSLRTAFNEEG